MLASAPTASRAQVPNLITYQGRVQLGGTNFNGLGRFKFAIVNGGMPALAFFWSNDELDSGAVPEDWVAVPVNDGLFTVVLGQNMEPLSPSIFANSDLHLRVWFNDGANGFQQLTPDQRLTTAPYAMLSGGLANGTVTGSMLAPGAVSSAAVTNHLDLGDAADHGSLRVFHNNQGNPSILLNGASSRISTYGVGGFEQMRAFGSAFGGDWASGSDHDN